MEQTEIDSLADELVEMRDDDGSRYVWFYLKRSGLRYHYCETRHLPRQMEFIRVGGNPQAGDIAWWPDMMGVYDPATGLKSVKTGDPLDVRTAIGEVSWKEVTDQKGPVIWYRHRRQKTLPK